MSEDRWRTRLRWVVVHPHDPAAGVQRATLLAVPGRRRPRPRGWPGQAGDAAVAARVVEELERGPGGDGGQPWAAHGWFAEAERWLRSTMERLGRPLTGPVRQARSGGSPVSCAPPPATATSGSRPTRPRPCSSTRGWSWAPWPGCSPARCRLRWPSSPNGAGWCWPTSARRSAGRRPWRWSRRWPRPTPACRSRPPGTSAGCWPRAAWTGALTGWPPRPRPGCRRSRPPPACPASTPPPGCRPTRRPGCGRPCPDSSPAAPSWPATPSRPRSSTATCTCPTWPGGRGATCSSTGPTPVWPPVPRSGHDPAGHGLRRRRGRGRAAGAAAAGLPPRVGLLRAARASGPGLGAGRPAGRPAPGGQLPVPGHPAAGRPPHGPVDRLVAPPGLAGLA
jgi:hypothetical protein